MLNRVRKRVETIRYLRVLERMNSLDEFDRFVELVQPSDFLFYRRLSEGKRAEIRSVMEHLGFGPRHKRVLDLGPAYGDSLDVCREQGAMECAFVEREPFFYTYNRLKGFPGVRGDFLNAGAIPSGPFDLLWVKGGVSHVHFHVKRDRRFRRWLGDLRLRISRDGIVVVCPWWPNDGKRPHTNDTLNHWFSRALVASGFQVLPYIEGHNTRAEYPATYVAAALRE